MPPCHSVNLNFQCYIGKMRSNASDTDQKLKTIKTCITKTTPSFMQKVLLSQQNQNNLFAVSSLSVSPNQPMHSNDYVDVNDSNVLPTEKSNSVLGNIAAISSKFSSELSSNKLSSQLSKPRSKYALSSSGSIPYTQTLSFVKQISSPIYGASHTITKPIVDELKMKCIKNNSGIDLVDENVKLCSNTEDIKGKESLTNVQTSICLPMINTLPKLYSMIAHNSRKQDKLSGILDKPGTTSIVSTEKTNLVEKACASSQILTSYNQPNIPSIASPQTFQGNKPEHPSSLPSQSNEFIAPIVTSLVDTNLKCGEPVLVDQFNDNAKHSPTSTNVMSHSSQTLLLALPENFNVAHFSNQTLNLDVTSQQILRALLEPQSTTSPLSNQKSEEIIGNSSSALCSGEIYSESAHPNNGDAAPKLSDKGGPENLECSKDYFNILTEPSVEHDNLPVEGTDSFLLNNSQKLNTINGNEKIQSENDFKDPSINDPKLPSEITGISSSGTAGETQEDNSNPLPVATINVDMIDGQPMYTIQIMGHYIPLAAITIPTSEGPLYLQSAASNLSSPSQASTTTLDTIVNESCNYTNPNEDTIVTTSAGANVPVCTTLKPRYTCEICGKSYIRSWSYYGHLRVHAGESKKHTCTICNESFAFPTGLKQHMLTHSTEGRGISSESTKQNQNTDDNGRSLVSTDEKSFVCSTPDCDKTLGNASSLKMHQRVHQEAKPYKCTANGCNKAFKTPSELSRHQFRHTGEKPYKCDKCDKAFVRNDDLKRHYFIHTGQKRFRCDQCDFSCIQSFDLVKHKYIHGGEKPYKCNSCSKQFTRPARLREHQRLHTGERPYNCDQCGKSFTQLTSLKSHKLAHGQKPLPCDKCDKMFTNPIELQYHMNTHLGNKPFQCLLCNKTFVSSKTLKRHAIVHTGEKPFECKVCKKKFARSSDLKVHMPVHEENKPYKCTECSKMFTRYSSLKEHHRLHTGEYPFRCDICNKIFNHRSHLNVHMRTHTGEKPHKCHLCPKEFSRKSNLNLHLRIHGADAVSNSAVDVEEDEEDGNVSDTSVIDGQETVNLETVNVNLLKTIQNVLKRKRDESLDSNNEILSNKRHITEDDIADYTEQVLNNLAREQPNLQVGEVTVVDTSNLSSILQGENQVIVTHLSSDQIAPLTDTIISNDYGAVVALGLGGDETDNDNLVVENLIQLNRFDSVQGLGQTFVMKEQAEEIQPIDQEQITEWQHEE